MLDVCSLRDIACSLRGRLCVLFTYVMHSLQVIQLHALFFMQVDYVRYRFKYACVFRLPSGMSSCSAFYTFPSDSEVENPQP